MRTGLNTTFSLLAFVVPFALAHADEPQMRFKVTELVELPHPMSAIRKDPERFGITTGQRERLDKELFAVFPPEMHPRMQRAWELQNRVRRGVMKQGKDSEALAAELDELSRIKREMADLHIDALRIFQDVLTQEQLQQLADATGASGRMSSR